MMFEGNVLSKREMILKAAAEIFSAKGFYGAKIEDIAQMAEIGKGTVYEYFRSKEQLFNELIKAGFNSLEKMLYEGMNKETDLRKKLECLVRTKIVFSQRYRLLARIVALENIPMEDSFRSWLKELHMRHLKTIEEMLQKGIDDRSIRPIDVSLFALLFYGGTGMIGNPFIDQEISEEDIGKQAAQIVDYYFEGIGMVRKKHE